MKKLSLSLILLLAAVAAFALRGEPAHSDAPDTYVALGDSLAVGVGASDPATKGYVPLFHQFLLEEEDDDMVLVNLAHSGDTSTTLITHGHLAAALAEIETGDVEVVTLDIGGNDLLALIEEPGQPCSGAGAGTPACFTAVGGVLNTFAGNFHVVLDALLGAGADEDDIIVMTYYNPFVGSGCPAAAIPFIDLVLEGGGPLAQGLNDRIRSLAADHEVRVAEAFGLLGPADVDPDCVHANDAGYAKIATAFIDAFDDED